METMCLLNFQIQTSIVRGNNEKHPTMSVEKKNIQRCQLETAHDIQQDITLNFFLICTKD